MPAVKDSGRIDAGLGAARGAGLCGTQPVPQCGPWSGAGGDLPGRIVLVADDLTGACDSAAAFVAFGHSVRVLLDTDFGISDADVIAVTTESRDLPAGDARARVAGCISRLNTAAGGALLFKKIDSAARGAFAAEIEAAHAASGAAISVVTPAFPGAGRTVENGVLAIRDWSGQDATVDLCELFRESGAAAGVLPAASEAELLLAMGRAVKEGTGILLCDAVEQADLERLAAAALKMAQPVLWAGSAGLARALAAQLRLPCAHGAAPAMRRAGRTLLFTGTPHPVSALQVEFVERARRGRHVRAVQRVADCGAPAEGVRSAFAEAAPAALILTGGDTASFVLRALGAGSIRLAGEVAPGIPWGIVEGGRADGCTVVTKSGGFGERDALARAFAFCETESGEPEDSSSQ